MVNTAVFQFMARTTRALRRRARALAVLVVAANAMKAPAQPIAYEANVFPENEGWTTVSFCDPTRELIGGWFEQGVEPCPWDPLPGGQQEELRRGLGEFVGFDTFLEWRAETTGPRSEIIGVAPAAIAIGGDFGTSYHFTFARDQVRMIRDNFLPIVFVDLEPDEPHTYRLDLHGTESYTWYIDGKIIDSGVPQGAYPQNDSAVMAWRTKSWYEPNTTRWDYVRFGVIPIDGSGDYDSDGAVTGDDFYFFHECFTNDRPGTQGGPENDAGPGCRFADFDTDGDVDLRDFAEFQNHFAGPLP